MVAVSLSFDESPKRPNKLSKNPPLVEVEVAEGVVDGDPPKIPSKKPPPVEVAEGDVVVEGEPPKIPSNKPPSVVSVGAGAGLSSAIAVAAPASLIFETRSVVTMTSADAPPVRSSRNPLLDGAGSPALIIWIPKAPSWLSVAPAGGAPSGFNVVQVSGIVAAMAVAAKKSVYFILMQKFCLLSVAKRL